MLHLKSILNLLPTYQTSVRNSYELAAILDSFEFEPTHHLVSFDVQSLFTRVPVQETLLIVERRFAHLRAENPQIFE